MTGSMIIIDLPGPVAAQRVMDLGALLEGLADRCREARIGSYDVEIEPARLGVDPADEGGEPRSFTVNIAGPGFGDEGVFQAEHAEDPDLETLIGFTPTHDVVVAGPGETLTDRRMLIELAALVQETLGGLADVRVSPRLVDDLRGLPGLAAVEHRHQGPHPARVFGTAQFLRAWAAAPEFDRFMLRAWAYRG